MTYYDKGKKQPDVRDEINEVITYLAEHGVDGQVSHKTESGRVGLGDVVESALKKFGITEERFKEWFNLKECGCSRRKKWLNGIFSWKRSENRKK